MLRKVRIGIDELEDFEVLTSRPVLYTVLLGCCQYLSAELAQALLELQLTPSPPMLVPVWAIVSPGTRLDVDSSAASLSGALVATSGSAMLKSVIPRV